jgi:hypothetical protein
VYDPTSDPWHCKKKKKFKRVDTYGQIPKFSVIFPTSFEKGFIITRFDI